MAAPIPHGVCKDSESEITLSYPVMQLVLRIHYHQPSIIKPKMLMMELININIIEYSISGPNQESISRRSLSESTLLFGCMYIYMHVSYLIIKLVDYLIICLAHFIHSFVYKKYTLLFAFVVLYNCCFHYLIIHYAIQLKLNYYCGRANEIDSLERSSYTHVSCSEIV